ncbi:ABC transporter permease subunit [Rubellicoccus peritrichatus]|uniref:ABC transporter permease subunit n=1 Tax=Rubellicoccus peritrichatus TaxID=3080537 RepID=A0AAQ3LB40_9BACT|nr:ABC transporter permease subunit [Puniceicoccus sp. CR14]WOO42575.1 ABC transporter permease subunit [Puniceicoccus sp. CR14]
MESVPLRSAINRIWVIYKKELLTFVYTPTIYVCFALFVFFANYLNFVLGHFFQRDEASLASSFFSWHPWLYAFFAPAISMRLWSEEYRQKTMELLFTMRFKPWEIVMGKFFSSWTVLLIALLLTVPMIATLYHLGPPDAGPLISGYLGSALLSGALLGVSIAAASFSWNQFISYILGACCCSLLLVLGSVASMDTFIQMLSGFSWVSDWLGAMNFTAHYKHFQRGVIALPAIVYFVSTAVLGLYCAQMLINNKRR